MPQKILFKYTSKLRPDNFFRGLDSIVNNIVNKDDYFILCSFDIDDHEYKKDEFMRRLGLYKNMACFFGISESKIDAINRDIALAPLFDIVVNFSDDQVFIKNGFDDIIRYEMCRAFPDMDGVLNFRDSNNHGNLMTMSVIGKKYFQRTNSIYNPEYKSEWADMEAQNVAIALGKLKLIKEIIYKHLHPIYKSAPMDEVYEKAYQYVQADRDLYFRRLANNFDL